MDSEMTSRKDEKSHTENNKAMDVDLVSQHSTYFDSQSLLDHQDPLSAANEPKDFIKLLVYEKKPN